MTPVSDTDGMTGAEANVAAEWERDIEECRKIAGAFHRARHAATGLSYFPGAIPDTLAKAYRIQDAAIALAEDQILGWKVGRIMPPHEAWFGNDRLSGPIFKTSVANGQPLAMPVFGQGFAAAEAEYLLKIGEAADPAKGANSLEGAAALIDAVHVGIEIASSPFAAINDHGPAVTISDFGNNHGLVVGEEIPDWRESGFADWQVSMTIDGALSGQGMASAMPDGPIGAARFLFEHLAERGIARVAGQWISSGAITGVHQVTSGAMVVAKFGDGFEVSCTIETERAR